MKELCLGCGLRYEYNPSDPKGATSMVCPSCQKKESRKKKRYDLLKIAGNGEVQCHCCGYRKFPYAIQLLCVRDWLEPPTDEIKARSSVLVCNNCKAAIDNGDIKYTVVDSLSYPVDVAFYEPTVTVTDVPLKKHLKLTSSDAVEMEIVDERREQTSDRQSRTVSTEKKRLGGSQAIDV